MSKLLFDTIRRNATVGEALAVLLIVFAMGFVLALVIFAPTSSDNQPPKWLVQPELTEEKGK